MLDFLEDSGSLGEFHLTTQDFEDFHVDSFSKSSISLPIPSQNARFPEDLSVN